MPEPDARDVIDLICDYNIEIQWRDLDVYVNGNSLARVSAVGHPFLVFCVKGRRHALETLVRMIVENIESRKLRKANDGRAPLMETFQLGTDPVLDQSQRQINQLGSTSAK